MITRADDERGPNIAADRLSSSSITRGRCGLDEFVVVNEFFLGCRVGACSTAVGIHWCSRVGRRTQHPGSGGVEGTRGAVLRQ